MGLGNENYCPSCADWWGDSMQQNVTFMFASLLCLVCLTCPFSRVCQIPGYLCFLLLLQYPGVGGIRKNRNLFMVMVFTITGAHTSLGVAVGTLSTSAHACLNTSLPNPGHPVPRISSADFQLDPC